MGLIALSKKKANTWDNTRRSQDTGSSDAVEKENRWKRMW